MNALTQEKLKKLRLRIMLNAKIGALRNLSKGCHSP